MTPIQLEALTLRTVDQVRAGQPVEDAQIELKRVLPADPYKAARRIGGHANASRGQPVVWIIGLDEDEGVTGADKAELSDWWPQVQRYFDDLPPELLLQPMNVPVEGDEGERLTVVALAFDTSRSPFVVTAKGQVGPIQREVPYRDATGLRSAKRSDIIRLSTPHAGQLEVEVLKAWVEGDTEPQYGNGPFDRDDGYDWEAGMLLYVRVIGASRIVLPAHRSRVQLRLQSQLKPIHMRMSFVTSESSRHVVVSGEDLIVTGGGRVNIRSLATIDQIPSIELEEVNLKFGTRPYEFDQPSVVEAPCLYDQARTDENHFNGDRSIRWTWKQ